MFCFNYMPCMLQTKMSLAFLFSLSKHLPSADKMSFNVDIDELENSHGATYVRKKAAKVIGENLPKEQGYTPPAYSHHLYDVHNIFWISIQCFLLTMHRQSRNDELGRQCFHLRHAYTSAFSLQPRRDQKEEEEKERYDCASPESQVVFTGQRAYFRNN